MSTKTGQKGCSGGAPLARCTGCLETFVAELHDATLCPECDHELNGVGEPPDLVDILNRHPL